MLPLLPGSMTTLWFTPTQGVEERPTLTRNSTSVIIQFLDLQGFLAEFVATVEKIFQFQYTFPDQSKRTLFLAKVKIFSNHGIKSIGGDRRVMKNQSYKLGQVSFQFCSPFAFLLVLITLVFNHPGYFIVVHQPKGDLGFNQCRKPLLLRS